MANPTKLFPALREKLRRLAKSSLLAFTLATYPRYKSGWFHSRLAAELDQFLSDVNANRRPRLIICEDHGI